MSSEALWTALPEMLGIFSVSSPWIEVSIHVNWLARRSNTLPLLVPTGEDGIWKVWWKALPPAVTEIIVIFVLGGDKSVGISGGSVMTESPADTWGGLHSSKGRIPPTTYVVICSLWDMAQQAGMGEVWIQSCPESLCLGITPRNQEPEEEKDVHLVFFFFSFYLCDIW